MGPFSSVVLMLSSDAGCLTNPHSHFSVAREQAGQGRIKAAVREYKSQGLAHWGGGLWAVSGMCDLETQPVREQGWSE